MAILLEMRYSKQEILEATHQIYLGQTARCRSSRRAGVAALIRKALNVSHAPRAATLSAHPVSQRLVPLNTRTGALRATSSSA